MNGPGAAAPPPDSGKLPTRGSVADEVLAKADAIVERLSAEFPAHASRDLAQLEAAATQMAGKESRAQQYGDIARIAHDIRGQGALFGYPLISRLASSLCLAVRTLEPRDTAMTTIIHSHVAAMQALLRHGVTGAGNRPAQRMAAALEILVWARTER